MSESDYAYLQQLEGAIFHAAATGSPGSSRLLDEERGRSADGLAGACLELLRRRGWGGDDGGDGGAAAAAAYDAVAFYALTTLQRSPLLACSPGDDGFAAPRQRLRRLVLGTVARAPDRRAMPSFVATKVGVLLALLVREEYPARWARPWSDVAAALDVASPRGHRAGGGDGGALAAASLGLYLSFLDAVCDEIVYPSADGAATANHKWERLRREQVKDVLRGFSVKPDGRSNQNTSPVEPLIPLEQTDAATIIGWLLDLLTMGLQAQGPTSDETLVLAAAVRAAATLQRYISWIDIGMATHQNLVGVLVTGLGGASSGIGDGGCPVEEPTQRTLLAAECAQCLREIVDRGMDEEKKLYLLTELNIFGTLYHFSQLDTLGTGAATSHQHANGRLNLITLDATQIEAVIAAAELINTAGLALIQGWEVYPTLEPTKMQMEQCLELGLACLAYDDIDVSGAVVDLVSRILLSVERKGEIWNAQGSNGFDRCREIPSRILSILYQRMPYPPDFGFDYEDEDESGEELYRAHLRKLYQRIVRLAPGLALPFVSRCLASLPQPLSAAPTVEVEAALRLVYHYGEGRRPATGAATALKDATFRDMIVALHCSDVAAHPHREVLLLYYDLSVRYAGVLKESPELLTALLASLSGDRGLQHPHARVRCRCCYLLLRLVKSVGTDAMRPHVEAVVDGCQGLLFPPASSTMLPIPPHEALYLFEAMGILLGHAGLEVAVQVRCATGVLTPHILSIENNLQNNHATLDVDSDGEQLSMSISAIAQLSKGWQKHPPPEVQAVLAAAVDVCRKVLVALPSSPLVRNRTAVLLQRMIISLGEGIIPAMPSFFGPLLSNCTLEEDVLDLSQLINQLCIKFKSKAYPAVDVAILGFLQRVLAIQLQTATTPDNSNGSNVGSNALISPPHLLTEQLSIRKQAFSTLQHIAVQNVDAVLYSDTNKASLGDVLQLMSDGAVTAPDPRMRKVCTQFFSELIQRWGRAEDDPQRGPSPPPSDITHAFFEFVYGSYVPDMVRSVLDASYNARDALSARVLAEFGHTLWCLKQSRQGGAEFHSRVVETLVRGDGGAGGSPAIVQGLQSATCGKDIELTLKAWKEALGRPP